MKTYTRGTLLLLLSSVTLLAAGAWAQDPQPESPRPSSRALPPPGALPGAMTERRLLMAGLEHPHRVEIDGVAEEGMRVISPLSAAMDVQKVTAPNDPRVHIQLGRTAYKTIRVSGELPLRGDMLEWFEQVRDGRDERRSGSVILLENDMQTEIQRMNFFEALPIGVDVELAGSRWVMTLAVELIDFSG